MQQVDQGVRFLTREPQAVAVESKKVDLYDFAIPNLLIHPIDAATPLRAECRVVSLVVLKLFGSLSITLPRSFFFLVLFRTE